jgi:class 3 adenylate cyclase
VVVAPVGVVAHRRRGDVRRPILGRGEIAPAWPVCGSPLATVRGGVTFGAVLSRDGDYFGPVVNLRPAW